MLELNLLPENLRARRVPVYAEHPSAVEYLDQCLKLASWCNGSSFMMNTADDGKNRIVLPSGDWAEPGSYICKLNNTFFVASERYVFNVIKMNVEESRVHWLTKLRWRLLVYKRKSMWNRVVIAVTKWLEKAWL